VNDLAPTGAFGRTIHTVTGRLRRFVNSIHPWMGTLVMVGAGNGDGFADLVGRYEQIFAIEADPGRVAELRRRFAGDPNVTVIAGSPRGTGDAPDADLIDLDAFLRNADVQYVDTYIGDLGERNADVLATLAPWIEERLIGSVTCCGDGSAKHIGRILGDRYEVGEPGTFQSRHGDRSG